ncbi:hypothetical protein XHC_3202 [Xanthomonas hortorum pv. carotae str. M081]|nr:hypothetical protein XHC_3202 [Xanthomonas hortorum pv. carotae str. M081]
MAGACCVMHLCCSASQDAAIAPAQHPIGDLSAGNTMISAHTSHLLDRRENEVYH